MRNSITVLSKLLPLFAFFLLINDAIYSQCDPGEISGIAYNDHDFNGIKAPNEDGLSGIVVRLYNDNGTMIAQTLTSGNGRYSFDGLTNGEAYLLLFDLNNDIVSASGPNNGTEVQRVNAPFCNADLGLLQNDTNCSSDTEVYLSCFVNAGTSNSPSQETIIGLQNNFNGSSPVTVYATQAETGSVWGMAYDNSSNRIYSSAFIKQNSALGPNGHDAIYSTDPTTKTTTLFTNLSALGIQTGSMSELDATSCNYGNQVGRIGIGAIDLDDNNSKVFAIDLNSKTVVIINKNNPTASNTKSFAIPNPGCSNNDYRPFAVKYHQGDLYVGVTCSAETSEDDFQTSFNVYKMNITSGNFSLEFNTTYGGGHWNDTPDWKQMSQWLTDIDFTSQGHMVLGISDRIGHRYCHSNTNSRLDDQFGEILMVANVNGEWVLEYNGKAGNLTGSGVDNNDGPGGGEFFGDDYFPANQNDHPNVALGSIAIVPGNDHVITSVFDPQFNTYSGGLHRYSTNNGGKIASQELYNRNLQQYFGKATGFGDIDGKCGSLGAEIGNYVWLDANCNGLQDADEEGMSGITLRLHDKDCNIIGTTQTDENGFYAFNNSNVDVDQDGIVDGVSAGAELFITLSNYNTTNHNYLFDNLYHYPTLSVSSGYRNSDLVLSDNCLDQHAIHFIAAKGNNSRFDIGLKTSSDYDLALIKTIDNDRNITVGQLLEFDITIINQGLVTASAYQITDYLNDSFNFDPNQNPGWTLEDGVVKKLITDHLAPGQTRTEKLRLTANSSANALDYINYAEISAAYSGDGEVALDVDSHADEDMTNDNGGDVYGVTNDMVSDNGSIDEDDHDPAMICIMDLALKNEVRNNRDYDIGDEIIFDLTVYNQGNIAADAYDLIASFPSALSFNASLNPEWTTVGQNLVRFNTAQDLEAGQNSVHPLRLILSADTNDNDLLVLSEIASFESVKDGVTVDFDSRPDTNLSNDKGGNPRGATDNEINDNGAIDEDDHDPAVVSTRQIDLALLMTTQETFVTAGQEVTFDIEIHNQGRTAVSSVMIMDYLPEGMTISDQDWTVESSVGANNMYYTTVNFDGNGFLPGDVHHEQITLKVMDDANTVHLINYAEIGEVRDLNGMDVSALDIDSHADKDMLNDKGGKYLSPMDNYIDGNGIDDEDDHDPAGVYLANISISDPCICKNNATTQFDGQFDETVLVMAPSGMTWYIDFVFDLFSPTSPAPPAAPVSFTTGSSGTILTESMLPNGISEYTLNGIVLNNTPYSIRVTNGEGAFLQISGGGAACLYDNLPIQSEGLSAVCAGSSFTYCIDPITACTDYSWTLSGGGSIVGPANGTCVQVDWSASAGGPYTLKMTPNCTSSCLSPSSADISIGTSAGPMSCLSEINISLNDDCMTQLSPDMFLTSPIMAGVEYQLMLTHHGVSIPNNIVTEEFLWQSLMAKVVNPCDGNSCWATVNIEDKLPPVIQCDDISMPCWVVDSYEPLVSDNCSTATYELVSETITPLSCDPDFIKEVNRTYIATDGYGNVSAPCTQKISLERIDIDNVEFPDDFLFDEMTHLECNDTIYNTDGFPRVDITGVPTLGHKELFPFGDYYCNFYIDYSDFLVTSGGCVTKIMRTWRAYEHWCSSDELITHVQTIEIADVLDPVVQCPANMEISTDGSPGCEKTISLPLPTATDDCSKTFIIDISYEGGFLDNVTSAPTVSFQSGVTVVTYNVYDECGNLTSCSTNINVLDEVSPVAICDEQTSVSLRSDGTAKAFAHTFDDGSYDDCSLYKFLVRRMGSNCECNRPVFDDMDFIGERNGRYYYLSKFQTTADKAYSYSTASGGMLLTEESCEESEWVFEQVQATNPGVTYYTGLSDKGHQGRFTFINHAEPMCDNWADGEPEDNGDFVIVDTNGDWVVVNGGLIETYFVVELSDPCGFSDEVHFCCDDVGEQMVVFRAIDKFGRFNDCMVTVDVQDKVPPTITCPPNMEVDCDTPIDLNDLSGFGEAVASDVCGVTVAEVVEEGVNDCGQGMLNRVFTASDNNGSNTCTQVITFVDEDPFDLSSVILPFDYFTDQGCGSGDLLPENLPIEFGPPRYIAEPCSQIGITYEDQVFNFAGSDADACLKILRTWTIIDWCQSDDPDYAPIVHEQTIKVDNVVGPIIAQGCEDLIINTNECEFETISFTAIATDDCTSDENLRSAIEITFEDGKTFTDSGSANTITFTGSVPVGEHVALISFSDRCGNTTTCAKQINVVNIKTPTAACINGLSVGLEPMDLDGDDRPDNEMACIFPEMIDASSVHECMLPIKLSFSPDTNDVKKVFDCSDLGDNIVELWVTTCLPDSDTLIQSFCSTTVEIQDNNNVDFCPKFDLALRKTINASTAAPFEPGDAVTFDIEVFNQGQGNSDAFDIEVVDYFPSCLILNDSNWTDQGNGMATLNTPIPFLADSTSTTVSISFNIDPACEGQVLVNFAEIKAANDVNGELGDDQDSTPDMINGNDGIVNDNDITSSGGDEDDHDLEELKISIFDLALRKQLNTTATPRPFNPGDPVEFEIVVFNQGNVDATNVVVTDYIPSNTTMDLAGSPGFTASGANFEATIASLPAGTSQSLQVRLIIDANFAGDGLINNAEITAATNDEGLTDEDSDINNIDGGTDDNSEVDTDDDVDDNGPGTPGTVDNGDDVDDYDPAVITVDCNLPPLCNSIDNLTVNLDGNGTAQINVGMIDQGSAAQCNNSTITTSIDVNSFDCDDLGSGNIVTLTILDSNGQSTSCTSNITVADPIDPTIQCQDVMTTLDGNGEPILTGFTIITSTNDNCSIVNTEFDLTGLDLNTIDCVPQNATITVTDQSGNTGTCVFQIAITNDPPVANCNDFTLVLDANGNATLTPENINNNSTDDCTTNLILSLNQTAFDCDDVGTNTVTLTVTDASNLTSGCNATVTVLDNTPPTALCNDVTINLSSIGNATVTPMMIDDGSSDLCSDVTLALDQTAFGCSDKGDNTVVLTVTDASGNSSTCNGTVTVNDNIDPVVNCIADFTVQLDATGQMNLSQTHFIASSSDNCAVVSQSATPTTFDCDDKANPVLVTVTVTDACNNTGTCTVNVTVEDNVAPECTLVPDLTFNPDMVIPVATILNTFTDNCSATAASATLAPNSFTCNELGDQTVVLTVTDDCGNSSTCSTTVTIEDPDAPMCVANDITVCLDSNGEYDLTQADIDAITNGSSAGCDDMFSLSLDITSFLCNDISAPVCVTVTLTPSSGSPVTCQSKVTVEDKILPTINCEADFTLDLDANGQATITPAMIVDNAADNCGVTQTINVAQLDCSDKVAPTIVTATATDQAGNTATCTTAVSVEDNMAPSCTLLTGLTFAPNVPITVADVFDTFSDNCATASSSTTIMPSMFDCSMTGTQTVTVTVNDDCGNSGTCQTDVEIVDNSVPTAVCQDITVSLTASGNVVVSGADVDGGSSTPCGSTLTFELNPSVFNCNSIGDNVVTLTVTSSGGQSATCTATVTIVDDMPPSIVCPADTNIPCNSDISDLDAFGDPTASDNCDNSVNTTETVNIDVNTCNVGTVDRIFTATDNEGNSSSCTQTITIDGPVNPIDANDITPPPSPVTFNDCFDPANLVTDGPIVDTSNADCFSLSITFSDNPPPSSISCVGNFVRQWTVVDSCQSPIFVRTYNQFVMLNDNMGPELVCPSDITVEIDSMNNTVCEEFVSLPGTATDPCGLAITVSNDSPFANNNNSADASGTYPGGTTTVTVSASDVCNNVSTCTYNVTIIDTTSIIKQCDKVIATIQPSMTVPIHVDATGAVDCSICPDSTLMVSWTNTSPLDSIFIADCSLVGITNYVVYLWQGNNVIDSCGNLLQILDGAGFCNSPNIGNIVGRVFTEDDRKVEDVEVGLMGSDFEYEMTDSEGLYAFPTMDYGGSYSVLPSKTEDPLNGVSTADIIGIQRHIMGTNRLDSPYKIIAADIDRSGDVSTIDLIELRKLILGIYDDFPQNTSWRMIDETHDFIDPADPFSQPIPEEYLIYSFDNSMIVDFVGVKIGDVNNTVKANLKDTPIEERSSQVFEVEVEEQLLEKGQVHQIQFSTDDIDLINGFQASLVFDQSKVELVDFTAGLNDMSKKHINEHLLEYGVLNMSWNKTAESNQENMFTVSVYAKADVWVSDVMKINDTGLKPEAYSVTDNSIQQIELRYNNLTIEEGDVVLYQNLPNPWTQMTNIKFYVPQAQEVAFRVFDLNGRIIYSRNIDANQGMNQIVLESEELKTGGVLYYELETNESKKSNKMILIKR